MRAKDRGVIPEPATKAILRISATPSDVELPIGERFTGDTANYKVVEKISSGSYKVECEEPGIVGNKTYGKIIPIGYIDKLEEVSISELLIPGEDEESTDSLRERFFNSYKSVAFGGNKDDYMEKVLAIHGVGACKVRRIPGNDVNKDALNPPEGTDTWIKGLSGSEDKKKWLNLVYELIRKSALSLGGSVSVKILDTTFAKASTELIRQVQEKIDPLHGEGYGLAPIGHTVLVGAPNEKEITISGQFSFASGYSFSALESQIKEVMEKYMLELRKDWAKENAVIRHVQVTARLLAIEGVVDIKNTKINGSADNLSLADDEIPILKIISEG
jgi:baseplate J-like protein